MKFIAISIFAVIVSIVASCSSSVEKFICCEANSTHDCCCYDISGQQLVKLQCNNNNPRHMLYRYPACLRDERHRSSLICFGCLNGYKC